MTSSFDAKKYGARQAIIAVTLGLVSAYLIMALMAGPLWISEFAYTPTLVFSAVVTYAAGYFVGRIAGELIAVKNYPFMLVGVASGFLIVWVGTFAGSLIGYFNEGLADQSPGRAPFEDYILKPLLNVSTWGLVPVVVIGVWFGWSIRAAAQKNQIVP